MGKIIIVVFLTFLACACATIPGATTFVLVGATGNLAKKYLWQSLLSHVVNTFSDEHTFKIYAAATRSHEVGLATITSAIKNVRCDGLDLSKLVDVATGDRCSVAQQMVLSATSYIRLKHAEEYEALNESIAKSGFREALRVYYLSISPSLYEATANAINTYGRPSREVPMRVVFEKPFGSSHATSYQLSELLKRYLDEDEIYRVDHYLGKGGVLGIAQFRRLNMNILNKLKLPPPPDDTYPGTTSVDVVLTETENVEGRTSYYDDFGVIRDVMQNHMTQVFVYSVMNYDAASTEPGRESLEEELDGVYGRLSERLRVLENLVHYPNIIDLEAPAESKVWFGQYHDYNKHLAAEREIAENSTTLTAARVTVEYHNPRSDSKVGSGLKVHFKAGKAITKRKMHVRIKHEGCEVNYNVQGVGGTHIALTGMCWESPAAPIRVPSKWKLKETSVDGIVDCDTQILPHVVLEGKDKVRGVEGSQQCLIVPDDRFSTASEHNNAYISIYDSLFSNDKSMFLVTEELLAQWNLWDSVLSEYNPCHSAMVAKCDIGGVCPNEDMPSRCTAITRYNDGFDLDGV